MRLPLRSLGIAAPLMCAAALATAASAQAATTYVNGGSFGGSGSSAGQFTSPNRIAVDSSTGDIFVADTGDNRVEVFTPTATSATFLLQFGDATTTNTPVGVAVDSSTGDVYVSCSGTTNAIVKFDPDNHSNPTAYTEDPSFVTPAHGPGVGQVGSFGQPSTAFIRGAAAGGIAVDPTVDPTTHTHDVLVADPVNRLIDRFDANGSFIAAFNGLGSGQAFTEPADVAVDSVGDVIVPDIVTNTSARIVRFAPDGSSATTLGAVPNASPGSRGIVVSADPSSGEAFASSLPASASAGPGAIYRFGLTGALEDHFGAATPADLSYLFGVAASGTDPGRVYAVASNNGAFPEGPPKVQVFQAVTPPTVSIDPVDPATVTADGATFSGTVNPQGSQVTDCEFQYVSQSDTGGFADATSTPCDSNPGAGMTDVTVHGTASGLLPTTAYRVRLVAANNGGAVSTTSSEQSFTTAAAPPVVVSADAIAGTSTATLAGEVNPRGSSTSCHFDFGTDPSYGHSAPCASDPGQGQASVYVHASIAGLQPGTTYHFRLVAQDSAGTTDSPDRTFTPGALPARAYELVSPVPTGGVDTAAGTGSTDGDRIKFSTNFFPLPGEGAHASYVATRTYRGWDSQGVDPPLGGPTWDGAGGLVAGSDDLSRVFVRTPAGLDPDDQNADPNDTINDGSSLSNGSDLYLGPPGGPLTWITRDPRIPVGTPQTDPAPAFEAGGSNSMSADGSVVVFRSNRQLLDEDTTPGGVHSFPRLYKWERAQPLRFIGVLPDGSVPSLGSILDVVSRDGTRVVFHADNPVTNHTDLYEQIDGQPTTVDLSNATPAECTTCSPTRADATFAGASADGHKVFFTTAQQLQDADTDSTPDLYEYDFDQPAGHHITQVSAGGAGDPTQGSGANVQGVAAVSDDGSHFYFVAQGVLSTDPSPVGQRATAGADNLYLYERDAAHPAGQTTFITTLDPADARADWLGTGSESLTSPNGSVLAFTSVRSLTGQPTAGTQQAYVYDERAGSLVCASCPADGSPPTGAAFMGESPAVGLAGGKDWVTSDGAVFFDTPTPLVSADANRAIDVYEYKSGELRLLTAGTGASPSTLVDASADGTTVFFQTRDALVPQDDEPGVQKIYAARIGGGFSGPPPPPPPCFGDDCRAALSGAPSLPTAASVAFSGPGNAKGVPAGRPRVLTRTVHGSTFLVRVGVPGRGRIAITGAAVRTVRKSVSRAGTYRLRVTLTAKAKRTLARRRKLSVKVRVVYAPPGLSASAATVRVTVKPAVKPKRQARKADRAASNARAVNHDLRVPRR